MLNGIKKPCFQLYPHYLFEGGPLLKMENVLFCRAHFARKKKVRIFSVQEKKKTRPAQKMGLSPFFRKNLSKGLRQQWPLHSNNVPNSIIWSFEWDVAGHSPESLSRYTPGCNKKSWQEFIPRLWNWFHLATFHSPGLCRMLANFSRSGCHFQGREMRKRSQTRWERES